MDWTDAPQVERDETEHHELLPMYKCVALLVRLSSISCALLLLRAVTPFRFAPDDDLDESSTEMAEGLSHVLCDPNSFFTRKRICVQATPTGHVTLCENRLKRCDLSCRRICKNGSTCTDAKKSYNPPTVL